MTTRTKMIENIAAALAARGITEAPTPRDFDALKIGTSAKNLRRVFGTYKRAMGLIFKEIPEPVVQPKPVFVEKKVYEEVKAEPAFVEKAVAEEPIVEIIDEGVVEDDPEDTEDAE